MGEETARDWLLERDFSRTVALYIRIVLFFIFKMNKNEHDQRKMPFEFDDVLSKTPGAAFRYLSTLVDAKLAPVARRRSGAAREIGKRMSSRQLSRYPDLW